MKSAIQAIFQRIGENSLNSPLTPFKPDRVSFYHLKQILNLQFKVTQDAIRINSHLHKEALWRPTIIYNFPGTMSSNCRNPQYAIPRPAVVLWLSCDLRFHR